MLLSVKERLKKTPLRYPLYVCKQLVEEVKWRRNGCPVPPPLIVKQRALRHYAKAYRLRIFVETGTHFGHTVAAMKSHVDSIYSIELSQEHFEAARLRFANDPQIAILHGDSAKILPAILRELNEPALFWLDAHYSGPGTSKGEKETPILNELDHILTSPEQRHVILIDDARCFGTDPAYPTLRELESFVLARRQANLIVERDSVRITPSSLIGPDENGVAITGGKV